MVGPDLDWFFWKLEASFWNLKSCGGLVLELWLAMIAYQIACYTKWQKLKKWAKFHGYPSASQCDWNLPNQACFWFGEWSCTGYWYFPSGLIIIVISWKMAGGSRLVLISKIPSVSKTNPGWPNRSQPNELHASGRVCVRKTPWTAPSCWNSTWMVARRMTTTTAWDCVGLIHPKDCKRFVRFSCEGNVTKQGIHFPVISMVQKLLTPKVDHLYQ